MKPRTLSTLALILSLATLAAGCSGQLDDPTKLPPITEADAAEIRQRDTSVEDEERAQSFQTPEAAARAKAKARAKPSRGG